jgi:hypothetical protein
MAVARTGKQLRRCRVSLVFDASVAMTSAPTRSYLRPPLLKAGPEVFGSDFVNVDVREDSFGFLVAHPGFVGI